MNYDNLVDRIIGTALATLLVMVVIAGLALSVFVLLGGFK